MLGQRYSTKVVDHHRRVFSCLANVNVAKDQREKLDPKTQPCIFLVYDDDEFNYQPWDLAEKKVIWSIDTILMEEKTIVDRGKERLNSTFQLVESQIPIEDQGEPTGSE